MMTTGMGRVLVTGATGFIAGHCVKRLLESGYDVRGTVRSLSDPSRVAHLRAMSADDPARLELVEADLSRDAGWAEAVAGCAGVLHVASPFPPKRPRDENEIVGPAVEGTRRVLEAAVASGTVKRVVLTSSLAAVMGGHDQNSNHVFDESDWSIPEKCDPYRKSKTLAERWAWDYVNRLPDENEIELVAVNPGFVLGPLLNEDAGTSGEVVRRLLAREMPGCPRLGWAMVDVRDVADAHLKALESPDAPGNRYCCAGDHAWVEEVAGILAEEFAPKGFRVPTRRIPYAVLWLVARFDSGLRLALDFYDQKETVSNRKIREELGWKPRPLRETLVDMGNSMIDLGVVHS